MNMSIYDVRPGRIVKLYLSNDNYLPELNCIVLVIWRLFLCTAVKMIDNTFWFGIYFQNLKQSENSMLLHFTFSFSISRGCANIFRNFTIVTYESKQVSKHRPDQPKMQQELATKMIGMLLLFFRNENLWITMELEGCCVWSIYQDAD